MHFNSSTILKLPNKSWLLNMDMGFCCLQKSKHLQHKSTRLYNFYQIIKRWKSKILMKSRINVIVNVQTFKSIYVSIWKLFERNFEEVSELKVRIRKGYGYCNRLLSWMSNIILFPTILFWGLSIMLFTKK